MVGYVVIVPPGCCFCDLGDSLISVHTTQLTIVVDEGEPVCVKDCEEVMLPHHVSFLLGVWWNGTDVIVYTV